MKKRVSLFLILCFVILRQPCLSQENFYYVSIENGKAVYNPESFIKNNPVKIPSIEAIFSLTIMAEFPIAYVWIYNEQGIDIFNNVNDEIYNANIPEGIYNILLGYAPSIHSHSFLMRDSISVITDTTIVFSKDEALSTTEYTFVRENSATLRINSIFFTIVNNLIGTGIQIGDQNIDSTSYLFNYNKLSSYFEGEWAVKGKQLANDGNLYLLNGQLMDYKKDTLITNDQLNLTYADFNYHLPDSIENNYLVQLFTFNFISHQSGRFDPLYSYPFYQRIFQDTSAVTNLNTSIFWQGMYAVNILYGYLYTSDIRIKENEIQGFYHAEKSDPPFRLSKSKTVHIGLTPTYWFGKFVNDHDTIKIRSPYGRWNYLFLSQTNDVLRHYPIDYSIYSKDSLYLNGQFQLWFEPAGLRLGFDSTGLTIPVVQDEYEMIITDNQNEVAAYPGISWVKASFDLNNVDKNPPYLSLFQVSSDGELANILEQNSENEITFRLEDDNEVSGVELLYAALNDTNLITVPLEENIPYYSAHLPYLDNGYYSLKIISSDASGNSIDCFMKPAFHIGEVTSLEETKPIAQSENFNIFYNYPNPFNSSTQFIFNTDKKNSKEVEIIIYDILGRAMKQINPGHLTTGLNKIIWDGTDNSGNQVATGMYIAKLKGGDTVRFKKLLLIR